MTDQDDQTLGSRSEHPSQETLDEVSEGWLDCLDRISQTLDSECSFDTSLRAIRNLRDEYPHAAWRRAATASTFANVLQGAPGTSLVRETIAEATEILSDGFCEFSARELRVAAADVRDIVLDGESDAFGAPALHRRSTQDLYVVAREVGDRRAVQRRRDVLVSALAESEPTPILRLLDGSWMEPLGRAPLLAHHAAVRQTKRAQAGDRRAMEAMVLANTRLVYSIAKNARTSFLETADYFQDGIRGLIRAIEKFDDAKDTQFSTYATWWIKQSIARCHDDTSRTIRVPVHIHDRLRRIRKAERDGRDHSLAEIAALAELTPEQIRQARFAPVTLPIDAADSVSDTEESPDERILAKGRAHDLYAAMKELKPRDRNILASRFGLFGLPTRTLDDLGEQNGLTRERIRQIESKALETLRSILTQAWAPPLNRAEVRGPDRAPRAAVTRTPCAPSDTASSAVEPLDDDAPVFNRTQCGPFRILGATSETVTYAHTRLQDATHLARSELDSVIELLRRVGWMPLTREYLGPHGEFIAAYLIEHRVELGADLLSGSPPILHVVDRTARV